jgi:hypothetical protein
MGDNEVHAQRAYPGQLVRQFNDYLYPRHLVLWFGLGILCIDYGVLFAVRFVEVSSQKRQACLLLSYMESWLLVSLSQGNLLLPMSATQIHGPITVLP